MSEHSEKEGVGGLTPEILFRLSRSEEREKFQRGELKQALRKFRKGPSQLWWQARWRDYSVVSKSGRAPYRKRWVKAVAKCTKAQAQKQLDAWIEKANDKQCLPNAAETFGELWERYFREKSAAWAKGTIRGIEPLFRLHVLPQLGGMRLKSLQRKHVQQVLVDLAADERSYSYCHKYRTYVKEALNLAVSEGIIAVNPAEKMLIPQTKGIAERFHTIDEVKRLLAVADQRDHLILRLCFECGFRPGELFALRWNDVISDFLRIDETVYEGRKKRAAKTRTSLGYVPISGAIRNELDRWRVKKEWKKAKPKLEDDYIFRTKHGTAMHSGNYLRRTMRNLGAKAKVEGLTFQSMRRTCATMVVVRGQVKDAQRILRHASATTTLKHYAKSIPESLRLAVESFSQEIGGDSQMVAM